MKTDKSIYIMHYNNKIVYISTEKIANLILKEYPQTFLKRTIKH